MKPKHITVQPFNVLVRVLRSKREKREFDVPEDAIGYCMVDHQGYTLALPWRYDEETTWHEAHHLARWLNQQHGVATDSDGHEIDVYLQEHIVREIKTDVYNINRERQHER